MSKPKIHPLAGKKDAIALVAAGFGVLATNPLLAGSVAAASVAVTAPMFAGGWLSWRSRKQKLERVDEEKKEDFILASDINFGEFMGDEGLRIGYTKDRHDPVDVSNNIWTRHACIVGSSGVGKTTLGEFILWQQINRQGGFLMIDAKLDPDNRDRLKYMCQLAGRDADLYVLNVDDPDNSNTYNPLLEGDADEKASRLLNLLPSSENNAGSDFYRQSANHALTVIFGALDAANYRYHFGDLSIMMQSGEALSQLERICPPGEQRMSLQVFLDQFRKKTKDGISLDTDRLKTVLGGMSGRIAQFAQGKFGRVCNTYTPDINLTDIVKEGKCAYFMLPTMGKDAAALNLGKMILSDLRTAVYKIQALPKSDRPNPPFFIFADEFGSYTMPGVSRIFEQSRAANLVMSIALQSFSQLNQVSPDFADMIVQNTWTKICFKFGSKDSPEMMAEIIGNQRKYVYSMSKGESESSSAQALRVTPAGSESGGGSYGESWRETEDFRISPDHLKNLGMGEAIVTSGSRVFHVKTPMLTYPKVPTFKAYTYPQKLPEGVRTLNFIERYKEFLMVGGADPALKPKPDGSQSSGPVIKDSNDLQDLVGTFDQPNQGPIGLTDAPPES